uniref:Uncharacterized protein n=1 Tax=Cacopsylla melanoneura TaxID=428564 RepID=A0A8D8UZZ4_9HEMI
MDLMNNYGDMQEEGQYAEPNDGYYEYTDDNVQQTGEEYGVAPWVSNSIFTGLNHLAKNQDISHEEISELEIEYNNLNAVASTSRTFKKEELNILEENFSILTRKAEKRKRLEDIHANKITKIRTTLSLDLDRVLEPGIKALKKRNSKTRWTLKENQEKAKLKIKEEKAKLWYFGKRKLETCEKNREKCIRYLRDVDMWMMEIEKIKKEMTENNEILKKKQTEISDERSEIQKAQQDKDGFDFTSIENDIDILNKEIVAHELKMTQTIAEIDKMIQTAKQTMGDLDKDQDTIKTNLQTLTNNIELVMKEKEDCSRQIEECHSKTQELHTGKSAVQNIIDTGLRTSDHLTKEIEGILSSLREMEVKENVMNDEMNLVCQTETELVRTIECTESTLTTVTEQYETVDAGIQREHESSIQDRLSYSVQKKEIKKNQCYEEIAILEKELGDIENENNEIEKSSKETQVDLDQKLKELLEQEGDMKSEYENLQMDLEHVQCDVTYAEQEIENDNHKYNNDMTEINNKVDRLNDKSTSDENSHAQLLDEVEQNIKTVEQESEIINQTIETHHSEILVQKQKLDEMAEIEKEHKENNKNEYVINELAKKSEQLKNTNIQVTQEETALQKDCGDIILKGDKLETDLKIKQEMVENRKKQLCEISNQVQMKNKQITSLQEIVQSKKQAIDVAEKNHKKDKEKMSNLFAEREKKGENDLTNIKKSTENKIRIFKSSEIGRLEKRRDAMKMKIVAIHKEIDTFKDKEIEIQGKISKKKIQLQSGSEKFITIANILQDHGYQDIANVIKKEYPS